MSRPSLIVSFGFKHGVPSEATETGSLLLDVRRWFNRNPNRKRGLRALRGDDPRVAADVLQTPGFDASYCALKAKVAGHRGVVWVGCTSGHHRSVYLAERLGKELGVAVLHWNYHDK